MQNYSAKIKNSTISHGTPKGQACGHGLFYSYKECSTNQPYFLQNKANFQKSQMDVNIIVTREYEKKSHWTLGENKPNFKAEDRCQMTEDR